MITALIILFASPLWLLTCFFAVEVLTGLVAEPSGDLAVKAWGSAVVVVPACNEAQIIADTIRAIANALSEGMRLLIVADNCSDNTAELARMTGAEVIERADPNRRGKGFALAFAVEHLRSAPPSILVVVDADCAIDKPSLEHLVEAASQSNRPCQAVNLLRADTDAPPLVQISNFAFMLKNLVRQRGLQRLAGRVHMTGTGMAVPFTLMSRSTLASDDIVEDLSLGLDMAQRGFPPKLVSGALVVSNPASASETLVQRRRWEGGFLATSLKRGPKLFADSLKSGDYQAFFAAIDLLVPPITLLVLLNLAALIIVAAASAIFGLSWILAVTAISVVMVAACAIFMAWFIEGRSYLAPAVLLRIPLYLVWKIPLYLSLGRQGAPREWLRTRR